MIEEQNFLNGYEITGVQLDTRMYKIIAASVALMSLSLVGLGQTNLLSRSACESPFVNNVCQVLDTVYTGSRMMAKNTGYVNDPTYDQIDIRNAEVLWTQVVENPEPPLEYPEGYFQIANPEMFIVDEDGNVQSAFNNSSNAGTFPPPVTNRPRISPPPPRRRNTTRKPIIPKPNKNLGTIDPNDDPIGDLIASVNDDKNEKDPKGTDNSNSTTPKKNEIEEKTATSSETLSDVKINRAPLLDFADAVLAKTDANQIDLTKNFKVKMTGYVDENGMLIGEKSQFVELEDGGDQAMIDLIRDAIEKVGSTGWLKYMSDADAKKLDMLFAQDDEAIFADVRSEYANVNRAKSAASGIRGLIQAAKFAHKNNINRLKDDEYELLQAAQVTSEGKFLVIKFNLEKPRAHEMITARLNEHREKKAAEAAKTGKKPNGAVLKKNDLSNAAK